ncbi:MAG: alpha/beta-type small acid-soluble spore protein [Clostridiales bacterium]|nr:alpha/beta-type small acid-soluble spore protein [Clostridiales bacterium]
MARSNKLVVPEAKQAMDNLKYEVANSINVNLKQGYNGDLTSKQAGSVGGEMVRRMIEQYEKTGK